MFWGMVVVVVGRGAAGIYIRHTEGGKGSLNFDGIRQGVGGFKKSQF